VLNSSLTQLPPSVTFNRPASSGKETAGSAKLAVSLSAISLQTVTVGYAVTGGTATGNGVDYTLANGTLSFSPGQVTQNIVISLVDDKQPEPDATVQITLTNPVNAVLGANPVHTFTILENPGPSVLVKDINPGPEQSYPTDLTNINGTLFFSADDGARDPSCGKATAPPPVP
jgi:hypothetical protein